MKYLGMIQNNVTSAVPRAKRRFSIKSTDDETLGNLPAVPKRKRRLSKIKKPDVQKLANHPSTAAGFSGPNNPGVNVNGGTGNRSHSPTANLNLVNIIGSASIKSFITPENFEKLPIHCRKTLLKLLPMCDRFDADGSKLKLSPSALNNEYFTQACVDFKERLLSGYLLPSGQSYDCGSKSGLDKLDPWKLKHFEAYFGEKLKHPACVSDQEEPLSAFKKAGSVSNGTTLGRKKSVSSEAGSSDRLLGVQKSQNSGPRARKRSRTGSTSGYVRRRKPGKPRKRKRDNLKTVAAALKAARAEKMAQNSPRQRLSSSTVLSEILKTKGRPRKKPLPVDDANLLTGIRLNPKITGCTFDTNSNHSSSNSATSISTSESISSLSAVKAGPGPSGFTGFNVITGSGTGSILCGGSVENPGQPVWASMGAALPRLRINLAQKTVAFIVYGEPSDVKRWTPIHVINTQSQFFPYTPTVTAVSSSANVAPPVANQITVRNFTRCSSSSNSASEIDQELYAISQHGRQKMENVESLHVFAQSKIKEEYPGSSTDENPAPIFPVPLSAADRPKSVPVTRSRARAAARNSPVARSSTSN